MTLKLIQRPQLNTYGSMVMTLQADSISKTLKNKNFAVAVEK